jgi:seryl-tRNA synthetase
MLDPTRVDDVLRRGPAVASAIADWREVDERRRKLQNELDTHRGARNAANEGMSKLDKKSPEFAATRDELKTLSTKIKEGEAQLAALEAESSDRLMIIPNAPHASVPPGEDEAGNTLLHTHGAKPTFAFQPKAHWDIGEHLRILDFEAGARITGARFTVLRDAAAQMTRALMNFMIDVHTSRGYSEVWPPAVIRRASLRGTGQLPKFEHDLFRLAMPTGPDHVADNDLFLSPTAEVQVTNLYNDTILDADQLPIKHCAYAPCFRAEAGSAGKDTRGLIRQHQFDKVEIVKFTTPETSYDELEKLREDAEEILKRLGLHYRVMTLCTGDMGFGSAKTYDIEVWLPGQDTYREISSCSNFENFQARRAKIRYRPAPKDKPVAVHTLNGSGIAIGRALVAVLENYQRADGSVVIPEALRPYMGGRDHIPVPPLPGKREL